MNKAVGAAQAPVQEGKTPSQTPPWDPWSRPWWAANFLQLRLPGTRQERDRGGVALKGGRWQHPCSRLQVLGLGGDSGPVAHTVLREGDMGQGSGKREGQTW